MGYGSQVRGHNRTFTAPPGEEDRCQAIDVFDNGTCIVAAWEMTDEEIEQIVRTKKVYVSFWSRSICPHYVGSENLTRMVVSDFGRPLPKQE